MTASKTRTVFLKQTASNPFDSFSPKPSHWRHLIVAVLSTTLSGFLFSAGLAHGQQANYPAVIEAASAGGQARIDVLGERFTPLPAVASSQSRIVL